MEKYNGLTNYETWAVISWIHNQIPQIQEAAYTFSKEKELKEWFMQISAAYGMLGVLRCLLFSAIDNVNWPEIEKSLIEDNENEL
jgi:hypothetical protein